MEGQKGDDEIETAEVNMVQVTALLVIYASAGCVVKPVSDD